LEIGYAAGTVDELEARGVVAGARPAEATAVS
jgi:hypothetical protein